MKELPELVLLKIIACLPVGDQVNVRKVSKLWKRLADECLRSRKELIVFYELAQLPLFWGHNNRPIDPNNSISVNWKFKTSNFLAATFQNVRSLFIAYYEEPFRKNLNEFVDHYSQLEHFELKNVCEYIGQKIPIGTNFYSEKLQTLFIGHVDGSIDIYCLGLKKLSFYGPFHLTSELNPLFTNLQFLRVNSFSYKHGVELPSLQVLYFADTIEIDIADFPKLKEVHFFYHRINFQKDFIDRHRRNLYWIMLIRTLDELLVQKITNERDLMVYYDGFLYRNDIEFKKFVFLQDTKSLLGTCFRNQITIENYPGRNNFVDFARTIRNSKIENTFKSFRYDRNTHQGTLAKMMNRMNKQTAEKLSRSIWALYVDKDTFKYVREFNFRELFKHVKYLQFNYLSQSTLDLLPEMVPNVLMVSNTDVGRDVTNFNFLARFKAMKFVRIQIGTITLCELDTVLENCKIVSIDFSSGDGSKRLLIKESGFILETNAKGSTKFRNRKNLFKRLAKIGLLKKI